jgi:hypothetical protein
LKTALGYNEDDDINDENKNNEDDEEDDIKQVFKCEIKNINNRNTKEKNVFFKFAPLLDPYKFLIG